MITEIRMSNVATYGEEPVVLSDLSLVNYLYGANSAGKTTIGKVIGDPSSYRDCQVLWRDSRPLRAHVFNRDYVDRSFDQSSSLQGVFTMGTDSIDLKKRIEASRGKLKDAEQQIQELDKREGQSTDPSTLRGQLATEQSRFEELCWQVKTAHDDEFHGAFTGYRNSRRRFMDKVVEEHQRASGVPRTLQELRDRSASIFADSPAAVSEIPLLKADELLDLEEQPVLKKIVVGKGDVDIAELIERLQASDWVNQGRAYLAQSDGACPFCQQHITAEFTSSLELYFDNTYSDDIVALDALEAAYAKAAKSLDANLSVYQESPERFVDRALLRAHIDEITASVKGNLSRIDTKKREPSRVVELLSVSGPVQAINDAVNQANVAIRAHNEAVENIAERRESLSDDIWHYLLNEELKQGLELYTKRRKEIEADLAACASEREGLRRACSELEREITELQASITSTRPTADAINRLLAGFGFDAFCLDTADDEAGYRLRRADGSDAKDTLSEGERNFVLLLYFVHQIRGTSTSEGLVDDCVAVFDDPVSSMDSTVLFIVSTLIKDITRETIDDGSHIRQVFVLTHNVHFHKEVSYFSRKPKQAALTHWLVRRSGARSSVEKCPTNPIRTAYELLWREYREQASPASLQNTMRRILEARFRTSVSEANMRKLLERFDGPDVQIVVSLIAWMHDGSHNTHEDVFVSITPDQVNAYRDVFRRLFVENGDEEHYNHMMEQ
jgi:wobble nucleotide-excising tRNase